MTNDRCRTIFVDFANISAKTRITGIPRVSFEYLKGFYEAARKHGVSVVPVYVEEDGLKDARHNLPAWTYRAPISRRHLWREKNSSLRGVIRSVGVGAISRMSGAAVLPLRLLGRRGRANSVRRTLKGWVERQRAELYRVEFQDGDILFMPAWWHDMRPIAYERLKARGMVLAPLVHDVLPISMPEYYETPWREQFHDYVITILTNCCHAFYISYSTKKDAEAALTNVGLAPVRSSVHYHGFNPAPISNGDKVGARLRSLFANNRPKVLMVGSIEPKKNYAYVLNECRYLWWKGIAFDLIIIGNIGWKAQDIVAAFDRHPHRDGTLHWITDASDEELSFAYANSDLFLSASLAEGFGLPIIEALAHGLPAALSDIPVFREIAGENAIYFDVQSEGALAQLIEYILHHPASYENLREKARMFDWPRWEEVTERMLQDLLSLGNSKKIEGGRTEDGAAAASRDKVYQSGSHVAVAK